MKHASKIPANASESIPEFSDIASHYGDTADSVFVDGQAPIPAVTSTAERYTTADTAASPLATDSSARQKSGQMRARSSSDQVVIDFQNVTKQYNTHDARPALKDINVTINRGEFVFLVGHSGSGKSTFMRLLNRELIATKGSLRVNGVDLSHIKQTKLWQLRRHIGCVFQDFKLLTDRTAYQNVAFALEVIGKSKHIIRTQVPEILRLVGLEGMIHKTPGELSGGEQQRVSIARAIINRPPLLICDEPTGNLDPETSLGIMRLLDRINSSGTTVLLATHDKDIVNSMRKRVLQLESGNLVRDEFGGAYRE